MKKFFEKFIKKDNLIHDEGIKEKGNHVDVAIIFSCIILSGLLIFFGGMAYYTAYVN